MMMNYGEGCRRDPDLLGGDICGGSGGIFHKDRK